MKRGLNKVEVMLAENCRITIMPDEKHEFLMTTNEVAIGYGIAPGSVRSQKHEHSNELVEGKHYFTSVGKTNAFGNQTVTTFWTKRGIVRLGFFIKSERARIFRDWAEDFILGSLEHAEKTVQSAGQLNLFPDVAKRAHNRLTKDRLVDILADVARIEDKELRLSLVDKLTLNK